jgi:hypothetical protein
MMGAGADLAELVGGGLNARSATSATFVEENAVLYCAASEVSLDEVYLGGER